MSFALLAKEVKHFGTLLAFDFKGHGSSKNHQNVEDMSIETLINETIQILKLQMHKYADKNFVLIGHSLGGSVCARVTDILTNK
jgi:alpha-beta hydrolase superfamily lysophospholipase